MGFIQNHKRKLSLCPYLIEIVKQLKFDIVPIESRGNSCSSCDVLVKAPNRGLDYLAGYNPYFHGVKRIHKGVYHGCFPTPYVSRHKPYLRRIRKRLKL